jgi:hypothetical protein
MRSYELQTLFDAIREAANDADLVRRLAVMGENLAEKRAGDCEDNAAVLAVSADHMMAEALNG